MATTREVWVIRKGHPYVYYTTEISEEKLTDAWTAELSAARFFRSRSEAEPTLRRRFISEAVAAKQGEVIELLPIKITFETGQAS